MLFCLLALEPLSELAEIKIAFDISFSFNLFKLRAFN